MQAENTLFRSIESETFQNIRSYMIIYRLVRLQVRLFQLGSGSLDEML